MKGKVNGAKRGWVLGRGTRGYKGVGRAARGGWVVRGPGRCFEPKLPVLGPEIMFLAQ